jgi:hypothetical protein
MKRNLKDSFPGFAALLKAKKGFEFRRRAAYRQPMPSCGESQSSPLQKEPGRQ